MAPPPEPRCGAPTRMTRHVAFWTLPTRASCTATSRRASDGRLHHRRSDRERVASPGHHVLLASRDLRSLEPVRSPRLGQARRHGGGQIRGRTRPDSTDRSILMEEDLYHYWYEPSREEMLPVRRWLCDNGLSMETVNQVGITAWFDGKKLDKTW